MATIYDVARRAGVSISTVSRVINGNANVSDRNRRKVEEAINALNYRPNPAARSLMFGRSQLIALIVPDIANPFFGELARGVQNVCDQRGYAVVIWSTDGRHDKEMEAIQNVERQQVEGICYVRYQKDASNVHLLAQMPQPSVLIGLLPDDIAMDSVGTFGTGTALRSILEPLVAEGRRTLAHVAGPPESIITHIRRDQYQTAVDRFSLSRSDDLVVETRFFSREEGRVAATALFSRKDRPDMVFAANDMLAAGILQAAAQHGVRIPQDVAVIGCDDIELARLLHPSLSTISLPKYELGQKAAELLLNRIKQPSAPLWNTSLESHPVPRASTGHQEVVSYL